MVKKLLLSGLAAIIMGLTPNCDNGNDLGYECISKDDCAETEQCVEGVCEEKTWPECGIKENVQPDDFTGTYLVQDPTCSCKYEQISFKSEPCDSYEQFDLGGVDKKTGELECFGLSGNCDETLSGNYYGLTDYSFTKCNDDIILMRWYNGGCTAYLEKISDNYISGTGDDCPQ